MPLRMFPSLPATSGFRTKSSITHHRMTQAQKEKEKNKVDTSNHNNFYKKSPIWPGQGRPRDNLNPNCWFCPKSEALKFPVYVDSHCNPLTLDKKQLDLLSFFKISKQCSSRKLHQHWDIWESQVLDTIDLSNMTCFMFFFSSSKQDYNRIEPRSSCTKRVLRLTTLKLLMENLSEI